MAEVEYNQSPINETGLIITIQQQDVANQQLLERWRYNYSTMNGHGISLIYNHWKPTGGKCPTNTLTIKIIIYRRYVFSEFGSPE